MITLPETETFAAWMEGLRDARTKARITQRLDRLKRGNFGDVKPVGDGIREMRIDYGPGYRVYYCRHTNGSENSPF
jgi:putative addiction module killer protein